MPLDTYPITPVPSFDVLYSEEFKTIVSTFLGANEQRQSTMRFPKRTRALPYDVLDISTEWYLIRDFYRKNRGGWIAFWFLDFDQRKITDEYMGRGTGAALTLDLHSKTTVAASYAIYEDSVLQVENTDYTFVSGGGEAGVDRITWIAGHYPALGALITSDFKGYLRMKMVMGDKFSGRWFSPKYDKLEIIPLREVQW